MKLYFFISSSLKNYDIGVDKKIWASPISINDATNKSRITKSRGILKGDKAILYCKEGQFFSCPFLINNAPDVNEIISDVWEGEWMLPFHFSFLGCEEKKVSLDIARNSWGFSARQLGGFLGPITIFSPVNIAEENWINICNTFDIND